VPDLQSASKESAIKASDMSCLREVSKVNIEELYLTDRQIFDEILSYSGDVKKCRDLWLDWQDEIRKSHKFVADNAVKKIVGDIKNPFVGYIDAFENIRMAKEQGFERFRQALKELIK